MRSNCEPPPPREITGDEKAFRAWYEGEFHLRFNEKDPDNAVYRSAFTAGQLHELRSQRERDRILSLKKSCPHDKPSAGHCIVVTCPNFAGNFHAPR